MGNKLFVAMLGVVVAARSPLNGQTSAADQLPRFEAATIKPVDPNATHTVGVEVYSGGRVVLRTLSLKMLICTAFQLSYWQLSGGADWTEKAEYNVEAIPPEGVRSSLPNTRHTLFTIEDERLRQMLQALLMDRFQLKFHRETKVGKVYVLGRNIQAPLKLRLIEGGPVTAGSPPPAGSIGWAGQWVLANTSMAQLAKFASDFVLRRPVLNQTELPGFYDYRGPAEDLETYQSDTSGSFLRLIREAGFKLESSRGPVEAFVIDSVQKPSPN